jgi:hypothetical protein
MARLTAVVTESLPEAMANVLFFAGAQNRPVTGVSQAITRGCLLAFRGWRLFTPLLLLASSTRHQRPPPLPDRNLQDLLEQGGGGRSASSVEER